MLSSAISRSTPLTSRCERLADGYFAAESSETVSCIGVLAGFFEKISKNTNAAYSLAALAARRYFTQRVRSSHKYPLYGRRAIH